jgi:glycosyltransferase involved in cell wall biosynthesis
MAVVNKRRTVLLASPYGQTGGGMGSIMKYLAAAGSESASGFDFKCIETRGGGHVLLSPLHAIRAAGHIVREAASGRLAVVHINLAEGGSVYRKAALLAVAKLLGSRVLLHLHAARIRQFHESVNRGGKQLVRWMFNTADHTVVLGDVWRRWVIETSGVNPRKVSVVYNGVPASPGTRTARVPGTDPFRLLFVGNLSERKGVTDLLRAFAAPELRSRSIRLVLAGGGPVATYQALVRDLGIEDRVELTGWISQDGARAQMLAADALILPSYDEGLPLVILEALASGTPVICTPVGSIPEVLVDGETALLVPPGDQTRITAAVGRLMDDADLRAALSAAGLGLYERLFTMKAFTQAITHLYISLLPPVTAGQASWHVVPRGER